MAKAPAKPARPSKSVLGRDPFSSLTGTGAPAGDASTAPPGATPPPADGSAQRKASAPPRPEKKPSRRSKAKPKAPAKPRKPPTPSRGRESPRARKEGTAAGPRATAEAVRPAPRPAPGPDPYARLERRLESALRGAAAEPVPAADADGLDPLLEAVGRALDGVEDLGARVGTLEARIDGFLRDAEARLETLAADGSLSPEARDQVSALGTWVRLLKELRKTLAVDKLRRAWRTRGSRARVVTSLVLEELREALRRTRDG